MISSIRLLSTFVELLIATGDQTRFRRSSGTAAESDRTVGDRGAIMQRADGLVKPFPFGMPILGLRTIAVPVHRRRWYFPSMEPQKKGRIR